MFLLCCSLFPSSSLCYFFYLLISVSTSSSVPLLSFSGRQHQMIHKDGWGWSGVAKLSCILHHWGIQLILAYSWASPAILAAGNGRGGMFLFLLFLHFHSFSSFFLILLFHLLFCLFSPFLWETTQNDPQGLMCR